MQGIHWYPPIGDMVAGCGGMAKISSDFRVFLTEWRIRPNRAQNVVRQCI